jgi:hypothetical protein
VEDWRTFYSQDQDPRSQSMLEPLDVNTSLHRLMFREPKPHLARHKSKPHLHLSLFYLSLATAAPRINNRNLQLPHRPHPTSRDWARIGTRNPLKTWWWCHEPLVLTEIPTTTRWPTHLSSFQAPERKAPRIARSSQTPPLHPMAPLLKLQTQIMGVDPILQNR